MSRYYNIFTQVQLDGPAEMGVDLPFADEPRIPLHWNAHWFGKLGQAQFGPIYLGWLGLAFWVPIRRIPYQWPNKFSAGWG